MAAARAPKPAGFNTKSPTIKRILQESRELARSPDPTLTAAPLETNLFEWHFTITGPPATPYADGIYHGRIVLPSSYPLRPPSFRFLTPSGRFEVNREICLSISGHHEETWQPAWGIRTALCAIRAFMEGDAKGQVGGLDMGAPARESLARESRAWRCSGCGGKTNEEVMREVELEWRESHEEGEEHKVAEVPEELRLAFREDLESEKSGGGQKEGAEDVKQADAAAGSTTVASSSDLPSVPVAISPSPTLPTRTTNSPPSSSSAPQARIQAGETVAVPRQRVTMTATSGHNGPLPQEMPVWVDWTIVGIVVALVVMLLKKFAATDDYDY